MKFWKPVLLSVSLLCALLTTIVYTACEKNPCNNVTCMNGGSCSNGACRCPTGWENTQCQNRTIDRYIGTYGGFSTCNNGAQTIDTAFITFDGGAINTVSVRLKSLDPKILRGYASNNESSYSIIVTNNDSNAVAPYTSYLRTFTITLQSDSSLSIHTYERYITNIGDTVQNICSFLGHK